MNLRPETSVVLVFDTDTYSVKVLEENIEILKKTSAVQSIICVTQVMNLEDELIRSCDIKNIRELTGSKNDSEYKHDLLKASNLAALLKKHGFDIKKFWIKEATGIFVEFKNESNLVKK
jgi:16S rRNA G966 N2-methylase RsmD